MNKKNIFFSIVLLFSINNTATATLVDKFSQKSMENVTPYPKPKNGMSRKVIELPQQLHEDNFKVELLIGKVITVDCNSYMISGKLERQTLSGWGYDYFVLESLSEPLLTKMRCPDDSKHEQLVIAQLGDESLQRYNSKLPIVIYVPQDIKVQYRFWEAQKKINDALDK